MGPTPDLVTQFRTVGEELSRRGLVTTHGGNLSVRVEGGFWVTGTGARLGWLSANELSFVGNDGTVHGPRPSSDTGIHAAIYEALDAGAVAHAHPPCATAWSMVGARFVPTNHEGLLVLGEVPIVAQDEHVARSVASALKVHRAVLVRGHGAYAAGKDLWTAAHILTALEESALVAWYKRLLG